MNTPLTKIEAYIEEQLGMIARVDNRELSRDEKMMALISVYPEEANYFIAENPRKVDLSRFDIKIIHRFPLVPISSTWGFDEFQGTELHLISVHSKTSGNTAYALFENSPKEMLKYWGSLDSFLGDYHPENENGIYPIIKMEDYLSREVGRPMPEPKKFARDIQDIVDNTYPLYMKSPSSPFGIRSRKLEFIARIEEHKFYKNKPEGVFPHAHIVRDERNNFYFIQQHPHMVGDSLTYKHIESARGKNIPGVILTDALKSFKDATSVSGNGWRGEGKIMVSDDWKDILKTEVREKVTKTVETQLVVKV